MDRINLASDYEEGAHPEIIKKLAETNMLQSTGYGTDEFCESARNKIRKACECPEAAVHFLVGGTQANATVIDALLSSYQGVVSAESGHINVHEAGAIELGGHKVMAVPQHCGKIRASDVRKVCVSYANDPSREHTVMPGMVYISQPTEFGTLYSLKELTELSTVCREFGIPLYADGARLAYALASKDNDVTLQDLILHASATFSTSEAPSAELYSEKRWSFRIRSSYLISSVSSNSTGRFLRRAAFWGYSLTFSLRRICISI